MRLVVVVLSVAVLACAAFVGSGVASHTSPFVGAWEAVDVDGSNMQMVVLGSGASGYHFVIWWDDRVSVCDDVEIDGVPGLLTSLTSFSGNKMTGVVSISCSDGSTPRVNNVEVTWKAKRGALNDSVGVSWSRP
jgi:hypothetical protein